MRDGVTQQHLDFLRGVAAVYVLVNHCRGAFFVGGRKLLADGASALDYVTIAMLQATSLGTEFVILFFVLSGFAMAHSIAHSSSAQRFYLKRVIRIWPPYIAATVFALIVGRIVGQRDLESHWLATMLYLEPQSTLTPQFWSLPYEVLFYALCPLILLRPRLLLGVAVMLCAAFVGAYGLLLNPTTSLLLNFLGNALLFFACGAVAYRHIERVPRLSLTALIGAAAVLLGVAWAFKYHFGNSNLLSNLAMIALSVLAIRNTPEFKKLNAGYFSYSIYIFHYALIALIVWALSRFGIVAGEIRNPVVWVAVVPPVLLGCWLLYWVTERPANIAVSRLRRRDSDPRSRPSATDYARGAVPVTGNGAAGED